MCDKRKIWIAKWKNPIDLNCKFFFQHEKKIHETLYFFVVSCTDAHINTYTHFDFLMRRRQFWWSRLLRCDVCCARCRWGALSPFLLELLDQFTLFANFYSVYVMFFFFFSFLLFFFRSVCVMYRICGIILRERQS